MQPTSSFIAIRKLLTITAVLILIVVTLLVVTVLFAFTGRDRSALFGRPSSISIDGVRRTYRTVGGSRQGAEQKLVVALHGFGGNGRQFAYYTALHNAFDGGTTVVYPDAFKKTKGGDKPGWNAQFCCGSGWRNGIDDVAFLSALITKVTKERNIPGNRVFVVGFSNGGFMAQRLAAERPELLAGVAVMSGTIGTKRITLQPTKPLPMLLTHGVKDQRVRYDGGESPGDPEFDWLSFSTTVKAWRAANGCAAGTGKVTTTPRRVTTVYEQCDAPLTVIEYSNNGHVWDGWRLADVWNRRPRASKEVARFINSLAPMR